MPARRMARRTFRRSARRRVQWTDLNQTLTIPSAGYSNIDLISNYRDQLGAETSGITIMRTHLRIWVTSVVTEGDTLALGLVVDDMGELGSFTYGSADKHTNPQDQPYLSWLLYNREVATGAAPAGSPAFYSRMAANSSLVYDVRSKRRVPFGDSYIMSLGFPSAVSEPTVAFHARVLLALS